MASILLSKIPQDLCLMVSREVSQDEWNFKAILKVIEEEVEARERAVESSVTKKNVQSVPTAASMMAGSAKSEHVSCCYCEQNHSAARCKTVTDIDVKKDILMKSGRCFVCLRRGHKAKECRSPYKCSACGRRRHQCLQYIGWCSRLFWGTKIRTTNCIPNYCYTFIDESIPEQSTFIHINVRRHQDTSLPTDSKDSSVQTRHSNGNSQHAHSI